MINLREAGRILYVSSVDISVGNGPGVNEREFVVALDRAIGDRAHFLIPRPVDEVPEIPLDRCSFSLPHQEHSYVRYPAHVLSQMKTADRILSRDHFDLLVFRLDLLPFAPLYITSRHNIPYALKTVGQGLLNTLGEKGGLLGKPLMEMNRQLVRRLVAKSLVADSVSKAQVAFLQDVLKLDSEKIEWIDNAVNTDRFFPSSTTEARERLGLAKFSPIVGYVGTRPWERGGMQLVETAPELLARYPHLGLVILGDGDALDSLERKARELQVDEHCVFAGYVPFPEVPHYVNSLDVGVSISLRSDRFAASELKVRQYLACGKPVVVSPGSNDFLATEKLGSTVQPTDLKALAVELEHWFSIEGDERARFENRAMGYISENLSMEAAINRRLDLWSERLRSLQLRHSSSQA
ncbi:MAG: glycosyltransferase [Anaerolineaceae bacterium]|nr:MAG: glycosyltransferase [Anaerolineaceae bacterium]